MIPNQNNNNLMDEIINQLVSKNPEGIKTVLEILFNLAMKEERKKAINADPYERTIERAGYANGFKPKKLKTRMGELDLEIPQVRGLDFYPSSIDKGCRSEKALKLTLAEMYIQGVSTRDVQKITEVMCGFEVSSTQVSEATKTLDDQFEKFRNSAIGEILYLVLDATYIKTRRDGSVLDTAVLIAYGINREGKREILGVSTSISEAEIHWREFLKSLQNRGMHGVQLIISDDHTGLKSARKTVLPSTPWQRCQFHMIQNAMGYAPKNDMKLEIADVMKSIFNCPSLEMALEMKRKFIEKYKTKASDFAKWFEENIDEGLTVYTYPKEHWQKIRTSNGMERINREIKRRTRVAVIFPNKESALRLITAILVEIHEEWITGPQYLNMNLLFENEKN